MIGLIRCLALALLVAVAPPGFAAVSLAITNGQTTLFTQQWDFRKPEINVTLFGIRPDGSRTSKSHMLRDRLRDARGNIFLFKSGETRVIDFPEDDLGTIVKVIVDVNYPVQFTGLRTISYSGTNKAGTVENLLMALAQASAGNDNTLKAAAIGQIERELLWLSTFIETPTSIKEGVTYAIDTGKRVSTPESADTDGRSGSLFSRIEPGYLPRGGSTEKELVVRGVVVVDALDSGTPVTATYSTAYTVSASTQFTDNVTTGGKTVFSAKGSAKLGDVGFESSAQIEAQTMQSSTVQTTNISSLLSTQTNSVTVAAGTLQILVLRAVLKYTETPVRSTVTGAWYTKNDIQQASGIFSGVGSFTFKPDEVRTAEWCNDYARLVVDSQGVEATASLMRKMVTRKIISNDACRPSAPTNLRIGAAGAPARPVAA